MLRSLNAALVQAAKVAAGGFRQALNELGINAQLFFSQNDGTLMALDYAIRYPILTVARSDQLDPAARPSYQACKMRLWLMSGERPPMSVFWSKVFLASSSIAVEIGGVRTNFRTPDLLSIALGGGTRITTDGGLRVGPASVGYRLTKSARILVAMCSHCRMQQSQPGASHSATHRWSKTSMRPGRRDHSPRSRDVRRCD